jgi:hypothetical protein
MLDEPGEPPPGRSGWLGERSRNRDPHQQLRQRIDL